MLAQEVYDTVVNHLRKQGRRAMKHSRNSGYAICAYRGSDNTSCAAGCLMLDEEYWPAMEGITIERLLDLTEEIHTIPRSARESLTARLLEHSSLIYSLQMIHDNYVVENWETEWKALAANHNLTYTPPVSS